MPASKKMLNNAQKKANIAAGVGDKDGRLPGHVKAAETNITCTKCFSQIRNTAKNVEAQQHVSSKHPSDTFEVCFPGATYQKK
jgi:hypothetical protein